MPELQESEAAATPAALSRGRRAAFAAVASLGTVVLVFLGLEAGLRVLRPDLSPESGNVLRRCHVPDPFTGWRPAADCSGPFAKEDFQTTVTTNAHGMRGEEVPVEAPPGVQTVAMLGDSFVWGYGVNDDETMAVHLDRALAGARVLNFGVCGYGTDQAYLHYREVARQFEPDVVVLAFFPQNDYADNLEGRAAPNHRPYFAFDADGVLRAQNLPLPPRDHIMQPREMGFDEVAQRRSYAYRLLYLKAKQLSALAKDRGWWGDMRARRHRHKLSAAGRQDPLPFFAVDPPPAAREGIRVTLGLLDLLRDAVRADGARLVLLVIPHRVQVVGDQWRRELERRNLDPAAYDPEQPDRPVMQWAAERGVPALDLFDAFAADPDANRFYLPTDRHFSAAGQRRAAELLAPVVETALAAPVNSRAAPAVP